jgi:hypothetical protein
MVLTDFLYDPKDSDQSKFQIMAVENVRKVATRLRDHEPEWLQHSIRTLSWTTRNPRLEPAVREAAGAALASLGQTQVGVP